MATKKYTEEETRERRNAWQREYSKITGYAAQRNYQQSKTKKYTLNVMLATEKDIFDKLESVPSKAAYIKSLIRADIERENRQ